VKRIFWPFAMAFRALEGTRFVGAILTGAPMPIPVGSLVATTRATIAVGESLLSGSSDGYERLLGITARLVYAQGSSFSSWKVTGRWADECKDMGIYGI
jgi:hypothetical protein